LATRLFDGSPQMLQRGKVRRKTLLQKNINTEQKGSTHQNYKNCKTQEKNLPSVADAVSVHWACYWEYFSWILPY